MPDDCVFCMIASGKIPSLKVHEDGSTMAFLDIRPLTRGHTLFIPKRHAERLEDLAPAEASGLMAAVHLVTPRICRAVGAPSSTIAINNGREAGQEVAHVHVHVVPRTAGDAGGPIHALFSKRPTVSQEDLSKLAKTVWAGKK